MDDYEGWDDYSESNGMEDLAGLTVSGDIYGGMDSNDEAAQWLAQAEQDALGSGDGASYQDELIGAATASDLQLGRISHVEPRIQAGIKAVLLGESLAGMHPIDLAATREEFGSVIGGDPKEFARQIKLDEAVSVPNHPQDIATVMSMLGNTAGSYLDRGPGGQLVNTYGDEDKQLKADEDLLTATKYVKELADLYLDDRTRGSSVEAARRQALEESITKRMIDGTFYEGSKDSLPMPNETGVTGIKATQGIYGSAQGTPFNRVQASSQYDKLYETYQEGQKTKFRRDSDGYKVFKSGVSDAQRNDALRNTPSVANSLFPKPRRVKDKTYSLAELEKQKRDQKYAMEQAQYKFDKARKILRQQMPTTRDESKGQIRMSGWDTPYGEQADLQNLRNEAAIQGIEWNSTYAGQGEASRGETLQSELTDFVNIQSGFEEDPNQSNIQADTLSSPTQGTQAWLDQRKGKITASTAAGLLKKGGVQERALELAMERLGTADKFLGNAHTVEGNVGEEKARLAFMARAGKDLTYQEAFFETNEKYEGFGVSPDGRLYDQEGESAGLLELKYLSSGSMKGALNKYTPQMQMQMAITGEDQTHFYALDKYTGEYLHEVVKADPTMQEQLIKAGTEALELSAELDNRGVRDLRKQIQSSKKPRQVLSLDKTGQTSSFKATGQEDEEMTSFDPDAILAKHAVEGLGGARDTALAKKMMQQDQAAKMKEALAEESSDAIDAQTLGKLEVAAYQEDKQRKEKAEKANRDMALTEVAAHKENTAREEAAQLAAAKEQQAVQKETTENLRNFGRTLQETADVASELAGLLTGGNQTGMDEVRTAAEAGLTTEEARGMRKALELGGVDTQAASRIIGSAGNLQRTFNDEAGAANQFTRFMESRGRSNLPGVRNLSMPSIQEFQAMNPQQLTSAVASMMQGKTPEERSAIANIFNMPELATYNQDPANLTNIDNIIDEEGLRETNQGITQVDQAKRDALEMVGSTGEGFGVAAGVAGVAAGVLGSKTVGAIGSKASKFISQAAKTGPRAASLAKSLSTVGKATPVAMVAGAVPFAARHIAGVEDDGGLADSALDVAEFAAYGAALGSVVPGAGTLVGAGVGAGVGVLNEGMEYMGWDFWNSKEDVVPSKQIGTMPSQTTQKDGVKQNINIEVTNEISPDLIRTTTDVDGEISVDEETGLSTGG